MVRNSPPLARTPLHHWHAAQGARFASSDGWQVPEVYSNLEQELAAAQEGIALADISASAKISLMGQGVGALTSSLVGDGNELSLRGVAQLEVDGGVLACRLTVDHLLLLAATTSAITLDDRFAALRQQYPIIDTNVTWSYAGLSVTGPRVRDLLRHLASLDVSPTALPAGSCAETSLAGIQALVVCPPDPEPTVHLYVAWDLGEYLWERLLETGKQFALRPIGLEAWRRQRRAAISRPASEHPVGSNQD